MACMESNSGQSLWRSAPLRLVTQATVFTSDHDYFTTSIKTMHKILTNCAFQIGLHVNYPFQHMK